MLRKASKKGRINSVDPLESGSQTRVRIVLEEQLQSDEAVNAAADRVRTNFVNWALKL